MRKFIVILLPIMFFLILNLIFEEDISSSLHKFRYKHEIYNLNDEDSFPYVVVGHSHARDSFPMIKNELLNLGLSGQDLYWSNLMLLKYNQYIADDGIIMIEISFNTFCQEKLPGSIRYVPLGFDMNELDISLEEYLIEQYLPLMGVDKVENFVRNNRRHFADSLSVFNTELELAYNSIEYLDNLLFQKPCEDNVVSQNNAILNEIISREQTIGRGVILYSSPLYVREEQIDKFHPKIVQFYSLLENIIESHEIYYFDHTYLTNVSSDYLLFRNANHLNNNGSLIYWDYFKENILGK